MNADSAQPGAGVPRDAQRARISSLVTVILPTYPEIGALERSAVEDEVTRYVAAQIQAMPTPLRIPYRLALLVFEWAPLVRYGRTFRRLPPAQRGSYLARWTDAPLAPMRDVVKLIRSSSLLVYFDHPLVAERLEAERQRAHTPAAPPKAANE